MLRDPRTENRSSNTATARCGGYSRDRIRKHLTLAMTTKGKIVFDTNRGT